MLLPLHFLRRVLLPLPSHCLLNLLFLLCFDFLLVLVSYFWHIFSTLIQEAFVVHCFLISFYVLSSLVSLPPFPCHDLSLSRFIIVHYSLSLICSLRVSLPFRCFDYWFSFIALLLMDPKLWTLSLPVQYDRDLEGGSVGRYLGRRVVLSWAE